jgi:chemotaxis response regulator CheB
MQRFRVLVVATSPLLRDILARGLSQEPRLEVESFPTAGHDDTLATVLLHRSPDVIVLSPSGAYQSLDALRLLYDYPRTVVITIEDDGKTAEVRRLRPEFSILANVSVPALVQSILDACEAARDSMPQDLHLPFPPP